MGLAPGMDSSVARCRFRRRRRRPSASWCALRNLIVAVAVANPRGIEPPFAAAAFAHRPHGLGSRWHVASRSTPHSHRLTRQFASSDSWSQALQNAVGSLDRRLEIKETTERKRREEEEASASNGDGGNSRVRFVSPLLEDGYPPAVLEWERRNDYMDGRPRKPLLLYLPGFDGTIVAPFLQFPSLGEEFDVRAMKVGMDDRSTFEELKGRVVEYLRRECRGEGGPGAAYLVGESFGGILATEVALELNRPAHGDDVELRGLVLINPATSYLRSRLYERGPPVANSQWGDAQYVVSLLTRLVPLFLDEGRAMRQLITILSSKGLPEVVNDPQREAYMGRVAFDLPNRLEFMPKDTLKWRLEEWLEWGCGVFEDRLEMLESARDMGSAAAGDADTYALLKASQELRALIVVGELDLTLPSLEESRRLASEVFRNARVHVVPRAGHASTCGGSLNLMGLLREAFPEVSVHGQNDDGSRATAVLEGTEELHGLVPRYDGAWIGLNPLLYWSNDYYRKWRRE